MLGLDGADVAWIYYYVHAGTHPNPRIAVNATHQAWKTYSSSLYIFGFILGAYNAIFWILFFLSPYGPRRHTTQMSRKGVIVRSTSSLPEDGSQKAASWPPKSDSWPKIRRALEFALLVPMAVVLSTAPFAVPWIAMPLMQEFAWNHRCDSWPVEAVLVGRAGSNAHSTATFFFDHAEAYSFDLYDRMSLLYRYQEGDKEQPSFPMPTLQNVTYDLSTSSAVGICLFSGQKQNCLSANMDLDLDSTSYLRFEIAADLGFGVRHHVLHAIDHDWQYSDDAPSMILRDELTGESVLRTAVTKRGDCAQLKVCLNTSNEARMLVPIGLMLIFQEKWAGGTTCGPKKGA
ncbi:hypothetical protein AURDEDRAFT_173244 [Auricularia subglabra TFB-10046 SS5]|uniref:Uncharacterized protein n=1 Tax=Auricularia subglabra (strain TFB-10046 / SS5) TaxID=717982 RepID=J0DB60_AURST|nr:hypothetical protein AURDEDRAFT_173244 [Auricularia subglabra TFB-10046 SS5]